MPFSKTTECIGLSGAEDGMKCNRIEKSNFSDKAFSPFLDAANLGPPRGIIMSHNPRETPSLRKKREIRTTWTTHTSESISVNLWKRKKNLPQETWFFTSYSHKLKINQIDYLNHFFRRLIYDFIPFFLTVTGACDLHAHGTFLLYPNLKWVLPQKRVPVDFLYTHQLCGAQ